jgi:hypothetical protein
VDKLRPFELVRGIVESKGVLGIKNVDLYDALFKGDEFLLEYVVDFASGKVAVKLIGSDDPRKTLRKYYEYIRTPR